MPRIFHALAFRVRAQHRASEKLSCIAVFLVSSPRRPWTTRSGSCWVLVAWASGRTRRLPRDACLVSKSVSVHLLRHGPLWLVERLQRAPTTPVARPPTCEDFALADELRLQDTHALQHEEGLAPYGIVLAVSC